MKATLMLEANNQEEFDRLALLLSILAKDTVQVTTNKMVHREISTPINSDGPNYNREEEEEENETKETEPIIEKVTTPEEAKKVVTLSLETLRAKTQEVILKGYRANVAELLNKFGSRNVTQLDEKHFEEYNAELEKFLS